MKICHLLLATATLIPATLLPVTHAAADSSLGLPLFTQSINEHSRISEGYANPAETLARSSTQSPALSSAQSSALNSGTAQSPSRRSGVLANGAEIWVSDVTTVLFNDADNDGYYAGFGVSLDVDVNWGSADVYANIYLQLAGASPELFHTTNVFSVHEQDSFDRYRVDVDLSDNFSAGEYDLIIDVISPYSLEIEDTVSHRTHNNLSRLPLESHDHQFQAGLYDPNYDPYYDPYHDTNVVTTFSFGLSSGSSSHNNQFSSGVSFGLSSTVTEYRGGAGWIMLLLLAAAGLFRAKDREVSTKP